MAGGSLVTHKIPDRSRLPRDLRRQSRPNFVSRSPSSSCYSWLERYLGAQLSASIYSILSCRAGVAGCPRHPCCPTPPLDRLGQFLSTNSMPRLESGENIQRAGKEFSDLCPIMRLWLLITFTSREYQPAHTDYISNAFTVTGDHLL